MDNIRRRKQAKTTTTTHYSQEVSSIEWDFINMSEQEEDLIYRMYKLVGDRWALIAGRIPGRKAEEIERFWIMKHSDLFASTSKHLMINSNSNQERRLNSKETTFMIPSSIFDSRCRRWIPCRWNDM